MKWVLVLIGLQWWHPIEFDSKEKCEESGKKVEFEVNRIFNNNKFTGPFRYMCLEK